MRSVTLENNAWGVTVELRRVSSSFTQLIRSRKTRSYVKERDTDLETIDKNDLCKFLGVKSDLDSGCELIVVYSTECHNNQKAVLDNFTELIKDELKKDTGLRDHANDLIRSVEYINTMDKLGFTEDTEYILKELTHNQHFTHELEYLTNLLKTQ